MRQELEEYHQLVLRVLNLQKKLFQTFEETVEIIPFPGFLELGEFEGLKDVLKPKYTVSEILHNWPDDISILPLVTWVGPRKGVFQSDGKNWFYNIHGFLEVQFVCLPSNIEDSILKRLKAGESDAMLDLQECGLEMETSYFGNGRTDGVFDQLMHVYTSSIGSTFSTLSEKEHQKLLIELVKENVLHHAPNYSYFFVAV